MESEHEADCREALKQLARYQGRKKDHRFAQLCARVDMMPSKLRGAIYSAIADGVKHLNAYQLLPAGWIRDRDDAIRRVGRGLRNLHRVLQHSPAGDASALISEFERTFARLTTPHHSDEAPDRLTYTYLTYSRKAAKLGAGNGRPRAVWRTETDRRLRDLKVGKHARADLLEVAGLTRPITEKKPT